MKLNEFLTEDFINSIPYISENEKDNVNLIYNWVLVKGYSKPISSYADAVNNGTITSQMLANIVSTMFSDKWKRVKTISELEIPLTGTDDTTIETVKNSIYGYNGESANDYEKTRTLTQNKEYPEIFEKLKENIDFREMFNYYGIIVDDIIKVLTIKIY